MKKPSVTGYARNPETGEVKINPPEKLLRRYPPTLPSKNALGVVQQKLAIATVLHRHHGDDGKQGVFRAVIDIIDYFESQGLPRATMEPLQAVAAALVDANGGIECPLFRPSRDGGGAPPTPSLTLAFEGLLAVVAECCVRHEKAEGHWPYLGRGVRLAAKLVNESALQATVTAKKMENVRERVRRCRDKSSIDRKQYDIQMASKVAQDRPLDWAKTLVAHSWVAVPNK